MLKSISTLLLFFCLTAGFAQPRPLPPGEILLNLKKLNVVGSVLYVAAHPDDENTAMLAWLAKDRLVRTGYLSITRGDGGQNLIGPEQADLMGLIRTHELIEARKIDGPEQFFTRANDFGFSKSTEEALRLWDHEKVLGDVVWVVRKFRPDVIITRFPPDARAGHGQHSGSAVLAEEAFTAAADPKRFPEQLQYVQPWQAKRVVWNSYSPNFQSTKPSEGGFVSASIGDYNSLLAKTYLEIAAESRSMHKSQGMGSTKQRGQRVDYLLHKAGDPAQNELFDGIDLSWKRIKGGEIVQTTLQEAIASFRPENPAAVVPLLVQAWNQLGNLPDANWKAQKRTEIENLIIACAGLWFEANATDYATSGGDEVKISVSVVKRSEALVTLETLDFSGLANTESLKAELKNNELVTKNFTLKLPANQPLTQPYWLAEKHEQGRFNVSDITLVGYPQKPADLQVAFTFNVAGTPLTLRQPISYKFTDPVKGELYRPLEVRPAVTVDLAEKVYVFADAQPKTVELLVKSARANQSGQVSLDVPTGWRVEPASQPFSLKDKYQETKMSFRVFPSAATSEVLLKAIAKTADGLFSRGLLTIAYDHIPTLTLFPPSEAKMVKLDLKTRGRRIGYIAGAGDDVPAALRQIGYDVTLLNEPEMNGDLARFDAIVVGVRAYNTEERLRFSQPRLLKYVENGGNLVVQYQTNIRLVTKEIGPYPLTISRDRVTAEEAPITFLNPTHPVLNSPNKITQSDFAGWVQERGTYFGGTWDSHYEPILASQDPGEKAMEGGLLVASYGKGYFVYTGYGFFRQLPAGVPGAYRLFANLLSVGK
ncbi:MAG: PIG-L family deacetylase [Cytophagaceae bacterium]|nr:PIG-L family deacetylase [Cytophagaceae bacterium]